MRDQIDTFATLADSDISRHVLRLQVLTVAWMNLNGYIIASKEGTYVR